MGWLRKLYRLDKVRAEMPPDPDKVIDVAVLALWQTPMVITALAEQGIHATFAEESLPKHGMIGIPTAHIYVMEPDRARAQRLIRELTVRDGAPGAPE